MALAFTGGGIAGLLLGGLAAGVSTKYVGERIPLGCAFGKLLVVMELCDLPVDPNQS
jgi:hypothetical protein